MRLVRSLGILLLLAACVYAPSARAVQVVIDYRYDTQNFFNPTTGNGQLARATVEAAAAFFSSTLAPDTLSAIHYVDPNPSPVSQYTPVWRQIFSHPGNGDANYIVSSAANASVDGLTVFNSATYPPADEFRDIQIPANQVLVYVGGSSIGSALGEASTGYGSRGSTSFNSNIAQRGKPVAPEPEYATWGGSVTFNNEATTVWNFNHTLQPTGMQADLYSVALHEIGHILGLCSSNIGFNDDQFGAEFRGEQALAAWKREDPSAPPGATGIPLVSVNDRHWKDNAPNPNSAPTVESFRLGTTMLQEAAMDPTLKLGTRKLFTRVDTFALRDIGWTVPDSVFEIPADFNDDGDVDDGDLAKWNSSYALNAGGDANGDGVTDGRDFLVWQRNYTGSLPFAALGTVPEPAAIILIVCGAAGTGCMQCRRRQRFR